MRVHAGSVSRLEAQEGLPVAVRGSNGRPSQYDPCALFAWAVERERRKHAGTKGALDPDQERARKDRSAAELNELRLAKLRGEVVEAEVIKLDWAAHITVAKNHLRGVPTRFQSRCPAVTSNDVATLASLINEALTELADGAAGGPES